MANKKDLQEAQSYSRRRLVTAFSSGIPDGVELTPKKNQTPIIVGVGLTVIALLVGLFYGYMKPGLPANWGNNKLIVAKNSAARYVSVNGTLHPVINSVSARLMIPSQDFEVITVDDDQLTGIPIESTLGILGAPDSLPEQGKLVDGSLTSCVQEHGLHNILDSERTVSVQPDAAFVANVEGTPYLVHGSKRHLLPQNQQLRDNFLRAFGIPQTAQIDVPIAWLNLFEHGSDIQPVQVPGSEQRRDGGVGPGAVVKQLNDTSNTEYVVMEDGSISQLDEFSAALYQVGKRESDVTAIPLSTSDFQKLRNADDSPIPADWPSHPLSSVDETRQMCAAIPLQGRGTVPQTVFLTKDIDTSDAPSRANSAEPADQGTRMTMDTELRGGTGSLLRASIGHSGAGMVFAVDSTGTAYPIPDSNEEMLKRLGYAPTDVRNVPRSWMDVFPNGVELSAKSAGKAPRQQTQDSTETADTVDTIDTTTQDNEDIAGTSNNADSSDAKDEQ